MSNDSSISRWYAAKLSSPTWPPAEGYVRQPITIRLNPRAQSTMLALADWSKSSPMDLVTELVERAIAEARTVIQGQDLEVFELMEKEHFAAFKNANLDPRSKGTAQASVITAKNFLNMLPSGPQHNVKVGRFAICRLEIDRKESFSWNYAVWLDNSIGVELMFTRMSTPTYENLRYRISEQFIYKQLGGVGRIQLHIPGVELDENEDNWDDLRMQLVTAMTNFQSIAQSLMNS